EEEDRLTDPRPSQVRFDGVRRTTVDQDLPHGVTAWLRREGRHQGIAVDLDGDEVDPLVVPDVGAVLGGWPDPRRGHPENSEDRREHLLPVDRREVVLAADVAPRPKAGDHRLGRVVVQAGEVERAEPCTTPDGLAGGAGREVDPAERVVEPRSEELGGTGFLDALGDVAALAGK